MQCGDAGGVRFDLAQLIGADPAQPRHAVGDAAALQLIEPRQLALLGRDDHLARPLSRDPSLVAIGVEPPRALNREPRLQRARRVIDAGVDHPAGVAALVGGDALLALEHDDLGTRVASLQLPRDRDSDDPGTDHAEVAAVRNALVHRGNLVRAFDAPLLRWLRMKGNADARGRRDGASKALAVLGALLALVGGVLLYSREELLDPAALSERAQSALSDQRVRLALAQPITDAILDSGPSTLVNARPVIESVVTGALGTPPVKAALGEAVESLEAKLFDRSPDTLLLNLADVASIAADAVEAVSPKTAAQIPERISGTRLELTDSIGSIKAIEFADDVRLGGLLLPPLAFLALLGSVLLARERRPALVRVGLALAGASLIGLVLFAVGHALLLSLFEVDLVHDAVDAIWDALLGDLRTELRVAAVLSLALAAAARFASGQETDPLAPAVWAARALRTRPERAWVAAVRGLSIVAAGLAMILEPGVSLEVAAVLIGAWAIYVGISELLAMVAPAAARGPRGSTRRRLRPGRVAALAGSVLVVFAIVVLIPSGDDSRAARPARPRHATATRSCARSGLTRSRSRRRTTRCRRPPNQGGSCPTSDMGSSDSSTTGSGGC